MYTVIHHITFCSKIRSQRTIRFLIKLSIIYGFDPGARQFSCDTSQLSFQMDLFWPGGSQAFSSGKSLFPSGGRRLPTHISHEKNSSSAPATSPRGRRQERLFCSWLSSTNHPFKGRSSCSEQAGQPLSASHNRGIKDFHCLLALSLWKQVKMLPFPKMLFLKQKMRLLLLFSVKHWYQKAWF